MNQVKPLAVVLAFLAELVADYILQGSLLAAFGQGRLSTDMTDAELRSAVEAITSESGFVTMLILFGTATTAGGGYLAARLGKVMPYYHGLAIGLLGMLLVVLTWGDPLWLSLFALLMNVPASVYGAHVAKKHMTAAE